MMNLSIMPVGWIESELHQLKDCPKQESEGAPEAVIVLDEAFAEAASDLKSGDTIIILTWLHQANRQELKTRPRGDARAPLTGIFSTRSPNRPNPIGLHQARIISLHSPTRISLSGIEVLDGTPVIDIKPVL